MSINTDQRDSSPTFQEEAQNIIHTWQLNDKRVEAYIEEQQLKVWIIFKDNSTKMIEPMDIVGIPNLLRKNLDKLKTYLSKTYIKLNLLSDDTYKLSVNQRILGGGNVLLDSNRLWPGGIVPYYIDTNVFPTRDTGHAMIIEAINEWNALSNETLITFVPWDGVARDYVAFDRASLSCSSHVGRQGGKQNIKCDLGTLFDKGSIMHELGHAIGLYHEHQRIDRDQFIEVGANLSPVNYAPMGEPLDPFDFDSLMMYPLNDHNLRQRNPSLSLNFTPAQNQPGQRDHISVGDRNAARFLFFHDQAAHLSQRAESFGSQDFQTALTIYSNLLTNYQGHFDMPGLAHLYNQAGASAFNLNQLELARNYFTQSLQLNLNQQVQTNLQVTENQLAQEQARRRSPCSIL